MHRDVMARLGQLAARHATKTANAGAALLFRNMAAGGRRAAPGVRLPGAIPHTTFNPMPPRPPAPVPRRAPGVQFGTAPPPPVMHPTGAGSNVAGRTATLPPGPRVPGIPAAGPVPPTATPGQFRTAVHGQAPAARPPAGQGGGLRPRWPVVAPLGATAVGGGAWAAAADTDHIGGLSGSVNDLEGMRADYQKRIDELRAGGGNWWRGGSAADREAQIKAMEENLRSGNFGGNLFDGRTFAQRRQQAQAQADLLARGGQGRGGFANLLTGYRDQAAVDAGMAQFDGDEMAKRFAALGINGPRGRRPAGPVARPGSTIGTGATNWDNYRTSFHNPYGGRDWSHLLPTHPANGGAPVAG